MWDKERALWAAESTIIMRVCVVEGTGCHPKGSQTVGPTGVVDGSTGGWRSLPKEEGEYGIDSGCVGVAWTKRVYDGGTDKL